MLATVAFLGQFCQLKRRGRADVPDNPEIKSANPGFSDSGSKGLAPEGSAALGLFLPGGSGEGQAKWRALPSDGVCVCSVEVGEEGPR